jgi:hypothetical protein
MKINLRPGVSPAMFWTAIGVGVAGTAATAMQLTAYAWAPTLGAFIALVVGFVQARANNPPPPPPPTA